jgi:hypothetical protein
MPENPVLHHAGRERRRRRHGRLPDRRRLAHDAPLPHPYQGRDPIGAFLRGAEERRGAAMRLVATRANA